MCSACLDIVFATTIPDSHNKAGHASLISQLESTTNNLKAHLNNTFPTQWSMCLDHTVHTTIHAH